MANVILCNLPAVIAFIPWCTETVHWTAKVFDLLTVFVMFDRTTTAVPVAVPAAVPASVSASVPSRLHGISTQVAVLRAVISAASARIIPHFRSLVVVLEIVLLWTINTDCFDYTVRPKRTDHPHFVIMLASAISFSFCFEKLWNKFRGNVQLNADLVGIRYGLNLAGGSGRIPVGLSL